MELSSFYYILQFLPVLFSNYSTRHSYYFLEICGLKFDDLAADGRF